MATHRSMRRASKRRDSGKQKQVRRRLTTFRLKQGKRSYRRQLPRAAVPSFFTLMNLFCGFLSIVQAADGRFEYAGWLIVLAAFFDILDGMMARLANAASLFGVELDSLCDMVSFGVAPSFLVYKFALQEFGILGLVVSSLPAICGAVRLARFNVTFDGGKKDYFVGMPIPGMAIVIVALILNFNDASWFMQQGISNLSFLIPIVFVLSFLMISSIPFDAIPIPSPAYIRSHPRKSAAYSIGFLLVVILQQIGLLIVLTAYLLYNIVRGVISLSQAIVEAPREDGTLEEE